MDRNLLKSQALLNKISNLTTNYENEIADLRVELHITSEQLRELREANAKESADVQAEEEVQAAPTD